MQTQHTKDDRYPNANTKHKARWVTDIQMQTQKNNARRMTDIQMQTQNTTHEGWQISKCKHKTQRTKDDRYPNANTKRKAQRMIDIQMQTQNQTPSGSTSSTGIFYWYQAIRPILSAFAKLLKATISFVISFRPYVCLSAWNNSALTGRIFTKFYTWVFFETLSRKFKFH